jgi:uncharacterized protein (TIGR02145 family)
MSDKFIKAFSNNGLRALTFIMLLVLFGTSCEKLEIKRITKVITGSVSYITVSSSVVQGNVIEQAEGSIKQYGHCWAETSKPTISNLKTNLGPRNTTGTFNSTLGELSPNTKYYVRAYATDDEGTSYGNEVSFITLNIPVPVAPTNLAADAESSTQITISWTDNSDNEEGFKIERSPDGTTNWTEIAAVGPGIINFQNINLTPSTTYYYRVRAFNPGGYSGYSNPANATTKINIPVPIAPTDLYADAVSDSAIYLSWTDNSDNEAGFKIERAGASKVWREIAIAGVDTPHFMNVGLTASVTYYYRVRAFNDGGNSDYTNIDSATTFITPEEVYDANDNVYHVVHLGTQVWTKENLIATHPYDLSGDVPLVSDPTEWANLSSPGYCWYNNDERYKTIYGALYNWWAVGWRRLCPVNWHVPLNEEWDVLIEFLGGATVAGGKMKVTGTDFWDSPNYGATNESGFTALPGGWRSHTDGTFMSIGGAGYWWSSTSDTETDAWGYHMYNWNGEINRNVLVKTNGFSIRCIRDY